MEDTRGKLRDREGRVRLRAGKDDPIHLFSKMNRPSEGRSERPEWLVRPSFDSVEGLFRKVVEEMKSEEGFERRPASNLGEKVEEERSDEVARKRSGFQSDRSKFGETEGNVERRVEGEGEAKEEEEMNHDHVVIDLTDVVSEKGERESAIVEDSPQRQGGGSIHRDPKDHPEGTVTVQGRVYPSEFERWSKEDHFRLSDHISSTGDVRSFCLVSNAVNHGQFRIPKESVSGRVGSNGSDISKLGAPIEQEEDLDRWIDEQGNLVGNLYDCLDRDTSLVEGRRRKDCMVAFNRWLQLFREMFPEKRTRLSFISFPKDAET
ncbi:hypothetical protein IE53DRAFT_410711 [Violaceomyces palustris]|uniref:Uncharacterized protein n=1 Tax=Violaceomyces palustris TaxID=1673888 RepID=A0ACD0NY49_9BASI|nr:hypothetical protein IE53DRAFT_410711 [Violaceomyces palustris]